MPMKNNIYTIETFLFIVFFGIINSTFSQANLFLHTDRNCFVSGDVVFFKAYSINTESREVLYVDLTTQHKKFVHGVVLKLEDGQKAGFIEIPDTLKTGYYSLRAYTYNSTISTANKVLFSKTIYVTNRFGNNGELYQNDYVFIDSINSVKRRIVMDDSYKLTFSDTNLQKRTKVNLKLVKNNKNVDEIFWGSVSVIPVSSCESNMDLNNFEASKHKNSIRKERDYSELFIENKGILVTGKATHKVTGNAIANLRVILAFQDSILRLKGCITDSAGVFNFLLDNCFNNQVVYLSAYNNANGELYTEANLLIDSKSLDMLHPKIEELKVLGYQKSIDSINVAKSVINKAYNLSIIQNEPFTKTNIISYEHLYLGGKLNRTTLIDDYVDLPDFNQIAIEILPYIKIRTKNGVTKFSVIDGINNIVRDQPMIFVDGIPLTEVKKILPWGSDKIKSVQVQIEPRYYGDIAFENGLIFIWTRNADFWDKTTVDNTQIFSIPCFQMPVALKFPDYSVESKNNLPDFRQTLYWNSNVYLSEKDEFSCEFYTSDETGVFEVVLRGITNNHSPVLIRDYIHVK